MSRSQPDQHLANPAKRWFEWNGETGTVRYYDKETKTNVDCPLPFGFVLLDELGSVRGWHEASSSGIFSNEVRDTRADVLVVRAFKGGTLAEGLYKDIKDRVNTVGGGFNANCYIAFKVKSEPVSVTVTAHEMALGAIRFKGAALGAWMEFRKAHRSEIYEKAIAITGYTEGKKSRVIFRVPTFELKTLTKESNNIAIALDAELQKYLKGYLSRTKTEQVEQPLHDVPEPDDANPQDDIDYAMPSNSIAPSDDDIPF